MSESKEDTSLYAAIGGEEAVRRLTHRFYALMDALPETRAIRRMHPSDLAGSEHNLFEYLSGWLGGPALYVARKGHPRLRMRHLPFAIGPAERDQWMRCMRQALDEVVADARLRADLAQAFDGLATHMINVPPADSR